MSAIEKPQVENTQQKSKAKDRQRALDLVRDVPDDGIDELLGILHDLIKKYSEDEASSIDEIKPGTLGSLAQSAERAKLFFDPPDLSERRKEYLNIEMANDQDSTNGQ